MLPNYKRRKSDRAFDQYFAVGQSKTEYKKLDLLLDLP